MLLLMDALCYTCLLSEVQVKKQLFLFFLRSLFFGCRPNSCLDTEQSHSPEDWPYPTQPHTNEAVRPCKFSALEISMTLFPFFLSL